MPCGANGRKQEKTAYLNAVLRNIENWKHYGKDRIVNTVFLGGGTPTVLETSQLKTLISAIKSSFNVSPNTEFTIEANPKTFDEEKLTMLRFLGVNRLSIGMQSGNDTELMYLSRIHTANDAKAAFELARSCGFDNINIDLMYGIPFQTSDSFAKTIDFLLKLQPEHISVYGLQLEEGTPLSIRQHKYKFPTEKSEYEMQKLLIKKLQNADYRRYEISNYSLSGKECKHNLAYWSQGEYIGFGPASYSYFNKRRFHLPKNLDLYCTCKDFNEIAITDELQSKEDADNEFIMLSLRLTRGVEIDALKERTPNGDKLLSDAESFIRSGFMKYSDGFLSFTEKGFNVSNYILSELLF